MAGEREKTFQFVVVGGGIAGVTCVEQVNIAGVFRLRTCADSNDVPRLI